MNIKILGTGCAKCKTMEKNARKAVEVLGIDATVEKVEDFKEIMAYGVMSTPALVVDEVVKIKGKVATPDEIMKHLK